MGHLQVERPRIYNCAGYWASHHSLCLLDLRDMPFTRVTWEQIISRNITALPPTPPTSPSCPSAFQTYTEALTFTQAHSLIFFFSCHRAFHSYPLQKKSHSDLHGNGKDGAWDPGLRMAVIRNSTNSLHHLSSMN